MKTIALSIFCATLVACSSSLTPPVETKTIPVDMEYNVSVETLEDTCGNVPAPGGLIITLNVALRTDGSMVVSYPTDYAPGLGRYKGLIVHDDGAVDYFNATDPTVMPPDDNGTSIVGSVTMDSVDLVIEERRRKGTGTNAVPCVRKALLHGAARPLWTAGALDGKYEATYAFYEYVCAPDPLPSDPLRWTVPLDVKEHGETTVFAFDSRDENLTFQMPTENLRSGNVNWSGPMYIVTPLEVYEYKGSVVGTFGNGSYNLRIDFSDLGDFSGCNYVLEATGAKRAPDYAKIPNIYRLVFSESDACELDAEGKPTKYNFEQEGEVVFQSNSNLTLMFYNRRVDLLPQEDGTYGVDWVYETITHSYTVVAIPPKLHFLYVMETAVGDGTCLTTFQTVGTPRYFADLAVDPRETPRVKPRLAESQSRPPEGLAAKLKNNARVLPLSETPMFILEAIRTRR